MVVVCVGVWVAVMVVWVSDGDGVWVVVYVSDDVGVRGCVGVSYGGGVFRMVAMVMGS